MSTKILDEILDEIIAEIYQAKVDSTKPNSVRTGDYRIGLTKAIDIIYEYKISAD